MTYDQMYPKTEGATGANLPPDYNSMGTTPYGGSRAAGPLLPYQTPMRCPTCGWSGTQEQCTRRYRYPEDKEGFGPYLCPERHPVIEDTEPPPAEDDPLAEWRDIAVDKVGHIIAAYVKMTGQVIPHWLEEPVEALLDHLRTLPEQPSFECTVCKMPILEGICENCCEQRAYMEAPDIMAERENQN